MKYLAAYLLLVLAGKTPSSASIKALLADSGVSVDDAAVDKVVAELEGKNIEDLITQGKTKLASVPSGGAPAPVASGASTSAPAPAKVAEKAPSSDDGGGMALDLFGDDGF